MRLPGATRSKKSFKLDHTFDDHTYGDHPYKNGDDLSISTITGGSEPPSYADDPIAKVFESPLEKKLRRRSHLVAYATTFVMTVGFSVVVTGVWPYLQALYPDANLSKTWLGWVIAANPLGQLIASPIVGYLGGRFGSIRKICYVTMSLFIFGNLFYSFLPATRDWFTLSACYLMVVSRFIVGLSSSNVTLCRSYLAASTTVKERTTRITVLSAAQATGYVVGPAIQTVVALIIDDPLLKYQTCGWIAAILGVINFFILTPYVFTEYDIASKERKLLESRMTADGKEKFVLPKADYGAVLSVLFAFFMNQFIYVLIETLFEPFVTDQYGWCDDLAVVIVGISLSIAGVLSIFMFFVATRLAKKYEERKILIFCAFVPIAIGVFLFQPVGSNKLIYCVAQNGTGNGTSYSPLSTSTTEMMPEADSFKYLEPNPMVVDSIQTRQLLYNIDDPYNIYKDKGAFCDNDECYGCPEEQTWCDGYTQLNIYQFYIAFFVVILGYPYGVSMSNAIMSKILGPNPQGLWMGILTASGSFARVLGPIFVSQIYTKTGTRWTFGILFMGMIMAMIELLIMFKRLIPMQLPDITEIGKV